MKKKLIMLLSLITISSCSQELKTIKGNLYNGTEIYSVLQSNPKIKHGEYKVLSNTPPHAKIEQGEYINGKKEGEWIKWYVRQNHIPKIKTQGKYLNDIKVGVWSYYTSNGDVIQKYDFDKNQIIENIECNTNEKYSVKRADETIEMNLDCPPTIIGGISALAMELNLFIIRKNPFENGLKGLNINETLSFYINEKGSIEDIYYTGKDKNNKLNELIIEFISRDNHQWIPAILNEQKVNAKIEIPITLKTYQ